ncbi:Uma2 family endonuclease [Rivularia sp. UHCC 0363]|uniref:Uma2 family endonuclease n=1 Tax=Rivularia sp. UHCC 0363 TaxID=3110244 RepID=UPI002B1F98D1|nr:Uma2 family endonuclease [Rivularia sp. UHCC 0363]MEA5598325.1 Uma2 family endonuclease [Rivularia sp. UHCC 0363]
MQALTVDFKPIIDLTDEQFYQLCQTNQNLRFERNSTGEIIIMPPVGGESSNRNAGLTAQLWIWNQKYKLGITFDSSGGFKLANGADRSPDAAWVKLSRWNELTPEQQTKFLPLAPDFVIELLSPSDSLKTTQTKMKEYISNGVRLGWLINRKNSQVEIYRIGKEVEVLNNPNSLSGEDVLPGFMLDLQMIW